MSEIKEELIRFKTVLIKIKEDVTLLSDVKRLEETENMCCSKI